MPRSQIFRFPGNDLIQRTVSSHSQDPILATPISADADLDVVTLQMQDFPQVVAAILVQ
jgi:ABC-type uncharacterized transport system permease subunit